MVHVPVVVLDHLIDAQEVGVGAEVAVDQGLDQEVAQGKDLVQIPEVVLNHVVIVLDPGHYLIHVLNHDRQRNQEIVHALEADLVPVIVTVVHVLALVRRVLQKVVPRVVPRADPPHQEIKSFFFMKRNQRTKNSCRERLFFTGVVYYYHDVFM